MYKEKTNITADIRRIGISFEHLQEDENQQIELFENIENKDKEKRLEKTIIEIKAKMGKNAILKGMNLEENATTIERNKLVGGHNAN